MFEVYVDNSWKWVQEEKQSGNVQEEEKEEQNK